MARIKPTNEYFLEKAKRVHGDKFDYSLVEYKGSHTKVQIRCNKGHLFEQRPADHWRGVGCRFCAQQALVSKRKYSIEEIRVLLHKIYKNKYSFDFTRYDNAPSTLSAT
jgi:ribosomal protein L19E